MPTIGVLLGGQDFGVIEHPTVDLVFKHVDLVLDRRTLKLLSGEAWTNKILGTSGLFTSRQEGRPLPVGICTGQMNRKAGTIARRALYFNVSSQSVDDAVNCG